MNISYSRKRVGAVVAVDLVGRDRVLEALAHLAELARHGLAVVHVRAVALLDLAGLDVHAALVRVRGREDVPLVDQPLERLRRRHVAEVEQHLVPEARVQAGAAPRARPRRRRDRRCRLSATRRVVCPRPTPARPRGRPSRLRSSDRGSAGSTSTTLPTAASCSSRADRPATALAVARPRGTRKVELDLDPVDRAGERRLGQRVGIVGRHGLEVGDLGQHDRQHVVGQARRDRRRRTRSGTARPSNAGGRTTSRAACR